MGATTIVVIHVSHANRAGSFFERASCERSGCQMLVGDEQEIVGVTYAKRPINIYKASKRTRTATETKGQGRAQEPTKAGEACGTQPG